MPRPDKEFNPHNRLDGPTSHSRGPAWSKYGPNGRAASSDLREHQDDVVEVSADDVTVVHRNPVADPPHVSKYATRSSSAPIEPIQPAEKTVEVSEWVSVRSIEDRTYHRRDELVVTIVEA